MLDEITLSKGKPWLGSLSFSRRTSALMASSPRTAYSTLWKVGLSVLAVNGRIDDLNRVVEREDDGPFMDLEGPKRACLEAVAGHSS